MGKNYFKKNNIYIGYEYAVVHMLVEIICFHVLHTRFITETGGVIYIFALMYDFLAFVPQFIFGCFFDRHTKIRWDLIGVFSLGAGIILTYVTDWKLIVLVLITVGNAILHETAAVTTTTVSKGMLSHSAIFVAGGSFGVIIGQHLGMAKVNILFDLIAVILIFIVVQKNKVILFDRDRTTPKFDLVANPDKVNFVVIVAFIVVTVRSFIGYAIPISWKKELWQAYVLFFVMGFGKGIGGILSDKFGAKKVGVWSTLLCIPFLLIGDNVMVVSVIGVFMFSMTMSITLGMLLSVLHDQPGLAFGVTTIGLFTGVLPVFITEIPKSVNMILVTVLSVLCSYVLKKTLKS